MRALNISRSYNSRLELGEFYDLIEERITEFMGNPPATGWDGVYEATSKH